MPKLMVQISLIDEDKEVCFADLRPEVTEWETDEVGSLFRHLQRNLGRCVGSVYQGLRTGETVNVGWCFEKRVPYDDGAGWRPLPKGHPQTYLQSAWVRVITVQEGIHA